MARLTNKLKHRAKLLVLSPGLDEFDRPANVWKPKRILNFQTLGITATEKYQSLQAKTDVVKRMRIRYDKTITQKDNRVEVAGVPFVITRIYVDDDGHYMELSLNYVD
ncbi:phage head closure protein [Levilactobacillus namurensis]|uniref:phage head closure protein n=1 Tax=Levilactobacillus namurensis TaxID=380393 RepID=UPI000463AC99|nr:phage head closure protein [Levilactobacillus namurensis]